MSQQLATQIPSDVASDASYFGLADADRFSSLKDLCIIWLKRVTDGALVSHIFSVKREDVENGQIYDYVLAAWGNMKNYQDLEFYMVQALSQLDRPLVSMRALTDYVELKLKD